MKEEICCPKFDPKPWDEKVFEWKNKKFVKAKVFTLFFMPVNFGPVMSKLMQRVGKNISKEMMCLSDHTSKWNMNIYVSVDKEVDEAENVTLNGKYLSKVYEGDFKDTGKWCEDYKNYAKAKKMKIKKWYMWYTTCPKCAKKYGKNYVAIINEVENE
ncbi:MAG TPA: hypothetical protein PK257_02140 [Candidatus Woesebacteria bacterium]|nr:hypothetical protein [Candidatus Woesebacteria bacterium]